MKNNTRKVWVNPVERTSAQGRHKQYYQTYDKNGMIVNTVSMKKVKEFDTGDTFMFPRDAETNKIYTGLNKTMPNPYKGLDVDTIIAKYNVHPEWHEKLESVVKKEQITKQVYYEIKHAEAPNAYGSNSSYSIFNLPPTAKIKYDLDKGRGKLDSFQFVFYPRPNPLETLTPRQEIAIILVEALVDMDIIAKSKDTANASYHLYYISEDNEEETQYSQKRDFIEGAMFRLYTLKNQYTFFKQYQFGVILANKSNQTLIKGDVTPERVKGALSEYISDRNKHQMEHVTRLNNLFDLQKTPEGADKFHVMYLIQQALNTGVFIQRDGSYVWPSRSGDPDVYSLGNTRDKIINFMLKELNTPEPKGKKVVTNYYHELLNEVKAKNVPFE
jgi:hypothetical protein